MRLLAGRGEEGEARDKGVENSLSCYDMLRSWSAFY
jgi:hypothetical protein